MAATCPCSIPSAPQHPADWRSHTQAAFQDPQQQQLQGLVTYAKTAGAGPRERMVSPAKQRGTGGGALRAWVKPGSATADPPYAATRLPAGAKRSSSSCGRATRRLPQKPAGALHACPPPTAAAAAAMPSCAPMHACTHTPQLMEELMKEARDVPPEVMATVRGGMPIPYTYESTYRADLKAHDLTGMQ